MILRNKIESQLHIYIDNTKIFILGIGQIHFVVEIGQFGF